ncbi:MAG: hypothetical protein WC549_00295 [Actinomycetota bacterium]
MYKGYNSGVNDGIKQERQRLIEEVEKMKKKIDKKRTTDEKRYPRGYNKALKDISNLLKAKR